MLPWHDTFGHGCMCNLVSQLTASLIDCAHTKLCESYRLRPTQMERNLDGTKNIGNGSLHQAIIDYVWLAWAKCTLALHAAWSFRDQHLRKVNGDTGSTLVRRVVSVLHAMQNRTKIKTRTSALNANWCFRDRKALRVLSTAPNSNGT